MAGKRIAVLGAGANGASNGADLTNAGEDVVLIEQWPKHAEAMRSSGVVVNMPEGTVTTDVRVYALRTPSCCSPVLTS